jgi:hypothetical protein
MLLAAPLDFQLRLDHALQQADQMGHIGVCRVFKGIPVNDPGARSRAWVTSAARYSSSPIRFGRGTHVRNASNPDLGPRPTYVRSAPD